MTACLTVYDIPCRHILHDIICLEAERLRCLTQYNYSKAMIKMCRTWAGGYHNWSNHHQYSYRKENHACKRIKNHSILVRLPALRPSRAMFIQAACSHQCFPLSLP
jgi:hypothetical protein